MLKKVETNVKVYSKLFLLLQEQKSTFYRKYQKFKMMTSDVASMICKPEQNPKLWNIFQNDETVQDGEYGGISTLNFLYKFKIALRYQTEILRFHF
jgi:hypothetical protein